MIEKKIPASITNKPSKTITKSFGRYPNISSLNIMIPRRIKDMPAKMASKIPPSGDISFCCTGIIIVLLII